MTTGPTTTTPGDPTQGPPRHDGRPSYDKGENQRMKTEPRPPKRTKDDSARDAWTASKKKSRKTNRSHNRDPQGGHHQHPPHHHHQHQTTTGIYAQFAT